MPPPKLQGWEQKLCPFDTRIACCRCHDSRCNFPRQDSCAPSHNQTSYRRLQTRHMQGYCSAPLLCLVLASRTNTHRASTRKKHASATSNMITAVLHTPAICAHLPLMRRTALQLWQTTPDIRRHSHMLADAHENLEARSATLIDAKPPRRLAISHQKNSSFPCHRTINACSEGVALHMDIAPLLCGTLQHTSA